MPPAFTAEELAVVEINGHVSGDVALLHWLRVPEPQRRRGLGSAAFLAWEASLPGRVRLIRLFAADTDGEGNSDAFWESLGFGYVYQGGEDLDYESAHAMHKGVRGRRTPAPR